MKLSQNTISILKNFTGINENIVFVPGKVQKTIDAQQTIMATAVLEEDFPRRAPIVELARLICNLEAIGNHDISFEETRIRITNETQLMNLSGTYGSEKIIKTPPDKTLPTNNAKNNISLAKEQLSSLLKFASINNLPYISFGRDANKIYARAWDPAASNNDNDGSSFEVILESNASNTSAENWRENFKTERLAKILMSTYKISFVPGHFGIFENEMKVTYIIASEKTV